MYQQYTADYWRQRAKEARAFALRLRRPDRRRIMLDVAGAYERMASVADRFANRGNESQAPPPR